MFFKLDPKTKEVYDFIIKDTIENKQDWEVVYEFTDFGTPYKLRNKSKSIIYWENSSHITVDDVYFDIGFWWSIKFNKQLKHLFEEYRLKRNTEIKKREDEIRERALNKLKG
jgi:hypothetical protein